MLFVNPLARLIILCKSARDRGRLWVPRAAGRGDSLSFLAVAHRRGSISGSQLLLSVGEVADARLRNFERLWP